MSGPRPGAEPTGTCEGCEAPATREDVDGIQLCDACYAVAPLADPAAAFMPPAQGYPWSEATAADVLDEIEAAIAAGRAMGHGAYAVVGRLARLLAPGQHPALVRCEPGVPTPPADAGRAAATAAEVAGFLAGAASSLRLVGSAKSAADLELYAETVRALSARAREAEGLRHRVAELEADVEYAAGECLVALPEPGSDLARVCLANRQLGRQRDAAEREAADLRARCERLEAALRRLADTARHGLADGETGGARQWRVALGEIYGVAARAAESAGEGQ